MNINDIKIAQNKVYTLLGRQRINEAIDAIKSMVSNGASWELSEELNQIETNYNYLLRYMIQGSADSERDTILAQIVSNLYNITDKIVIQMSSGQSFELFYTLRTSMHHPLDILMQQRKQAIERYNLLNSVDDKQTKAIVDSLVAREAAERNIFNVIWSSLPLSANDSAILTQAILDSEQATYFKGLLISALLLGLTKFYDETKLILLLNAYINSTETDIQMRALTAAIIALHTHANRAELSKAVKETVQSAEEMPNFKKDFDSILMRLVSTRNTDNITKKVKEDLIPNLKKMTPDMLRKFRDKNSPIDMSELEGNPEWHDLLDKSGISKKMEELNEIQMQGGDVFISTFAQLKSFAFFNIMANWFMPFHTDSADIYRLLGEQNLSLAKLIEKAPMLCNSDKYSFVLSLETVPESQRQMMLSQFNQQNAAAIELQSEEVSNEENVRDNIANRYIQDLYRFYKLFSRRGEFSHFFDSNMDMLKLPFLRSSVDDKRLLTILAEFYLKNSFYSDAIRYYRHLINLNAEVEPHTYQKLAFALQSEGDFEQAIKYYSLYELADDQNAWNYRHLASCYRVLKQWDKAIECYRKADAIDPNKSSTILNTGHCLLELGKIDEALQCYYKIDFIEENSHKAWRPIAWCTFLQGNVEQSRSYYDRIMNQDSPSMQDHLNYGHLLLCSGDIKNAIAQYSKSVASAGNDFNAFERALYADASTLQEHGIKNSDIPLVLDAVQMVIRNGTM